jgi:exonuclease III
MGNGPTVRGLLDLQKKEDPDVLFLSETKMRREKLEGLKWKLGMPNMFVKDCEGLSGGLAIFWKNTINLRVLPFMSKYHIDTKIMEPDGFVWRSTGIYGEPKTKDRGKTWKLLRTLKHQSNKPWLCAGDFNEVLFSWEKEGGAPKPQKQMDMFKEALEICELDDLGFVGDPFTWRNHSHDVDKYVKERLDRAVASESWKMRFPSFKVHNVEPRHSDHRPIVVDTHGGVGQRGSSARSSMPWFEARWLEEEDCRGIVENAWGKEVELGGNGVMKGVRGVLNDLVDWSRNILGDLEKRINKLKELEAWRRKPISKEQVQKEEVLRFKLSRLKI